MCKIFFFSFEFQVRNAVLKTTFNLPAPPIKDMKHNNFYKFQLDWKPVDNVLYELLCTNQFTTEDSYYYVTVRKVNKFNKSKVNHEMI